MKNQDKEGKVKNLDYPTVNGIGYIGVGKYFRSINGKRTPAYRSWSRMLGRSYDLYCQSKNPTYAGCRVANEWHNFQVYAEWHYSQPNNGKTGFHLDKDLRIKGNKLYGPDTCSFVPCQINTLLNDSGSRRGNLPQGVSRNSNGNSFVARLTVNGKGTYLGTYSSPEQAFEVYKTAKEDNVKAMAEKWKGWLHQEVYDCLMVWKVNKDF